MAAAWQLDCSVGASGFQPWLQPCVARVSTTAGSKTEQWVAINPLDPLNVVVGSKDLNPESSPGCVWNGVSVTKDGGKSWTETVIGGRYVDREPTSIYYGYQCNTDPRFEFGFDGLLHYSVEIYTLNRDVYDLSTQEGLPKAFSRIVLATSSDGGLTWPQAIVWSAAGFDDYGRMAVSPLTGSIFEAVGDIGTGMTCHILSSRDHGQTAAPPLKITPTSTPADSRCRDIQVSPEGVLVVVFQGPQLIFGLLDESSIEVVPYRIFMRSDDDGLTFREVGGFNAAATTPNPSENDIDEPCIDDMVYDHSDGPHRGRLYLIDCWSATGDSDVYLRWSDDDGSTWTEPVLVHSPSEHDQFLANVAVAGDGSVHVFYMDKRWDEENRLTGVTHAWSLDGGAAWVEEQVTGLLSDPDLGRHQDGYAFWGDYMGVAAWGDHVWAAFPDTSLGSESVSAVAHASLR